MLGKPKYKIGDVVRFRFDRGEEKTEHYGSIAIVDSYGTWGQDQEVSYDIRGIDEKGIFKHVMESEVIGLYENMCIRGD